MLRSDVLRKALLFTFAVVIVMILHHFKEEVAACENCKEKEKKAHMGFGTVGEVGHQDYNPMTYLTDWNFSHLPTDQRSKFYKETKLSGGRLLREYWIYTVNKEIEIAPGVFFPAWTYNGQVPGPTIRATEGDLIRIHAFSRISPGFNGRGYAASICSSGGYFFI